MASAAGTSVSKSTTRISGSVRSTSSAVYSGLGERCFEKPRADAYLASSICNFALSRRTISASAAVSAVMMMGPLKP